MEPSILCVFVLSECDVGPVQGMDSHHLAAMQVEHYNADIVLHCPQILC